jgi:hypothetical protein
VSRVLAAQTASLSLHVVFAVLVLLVVGRLRRTPFATRRAWHLSAWAFTIIAVSGALQGATALLAVRGGPGSAVWDLYLSWAAGGNYGRSLVVIVYGASLVALALRPRFPSDSPHPWGWAMLASTGVGMVVGHVEGPFGSTNHLSHLAVLTAAGVIALLMALLAAAVVDNMDQLLWFTLAVYTLKDALSVSFFSLLAWFQFPASQVDATVLYAMAIGALLLMCALVLRRLVLARREEYVPSLFERVHGGRRRLLI